MNEAAAANYAAALTLLGGLLLAGAISVRRASNEPKQWVAECRRVRVHPVRHR